MRVYELAKELGIESKSLLAILKDMGEFVRSASSTLDNRAVLRLRQHISERPQVLPLTAEISSRATPDARWNSASASLKAASKEILPDSLLEGTPYSLPLECSKELQTLSDGQNSVRSQIGTAMAKFRQRGLLEGFARNQNYQVVHESNRLELEGPNLAGTIQAIESPTGQNFVAGGLDAGILVSLLQQDRDTYLALGLEAGPRKGQVSPGQD